MVLFVLLRVLTLLSYLPLRLLHGLGILAGWLVYAASPTYAARLRENLTASGVAPDPEERRRLLRRCIGEAGKSTLELFPVWLRSERATLQLMRSCSGWEHVDAALARGKGLIFLTPHLGCFEISSLYYAARHPITVLYRPPKLRWLQPLLEVGRQRGQVSLAPTDMRGVKALLKALKRGEAIGILPDQAPGKGEGVWVEFFGRPAYTMTLATRLAQNTGATILMAFAERLPHGRGFHFHIEPPLPVLPDSPEQAARVINVAVEELVRRQPAQYLWSYNRYKVPAGVEPPPP